MSRSSDRLSESSETTVSDDPRTVAWDFLYFLSHLFFSFIYVVFFLWAMLFLWCTLQVTVLPRMRLPILSYCERVPVLYHVMDILLRCLVAQQERLMALVYSTTSNLQYLSTNNIYNESIYSVYSIDLVERVIVVALEATEILLAYIWEVAALVLFWHIQKPILGEDCDSHCIVLFH